MSILTELEGNDTPSDSKLAALVGEGKKYKTVEDLAKAYVNADMHITELRDDLEERKRNEKMLQEVLNEIRSQPNRNGDEPVTPPPQSTNNLTPEEVANIARQTVQQNVLEQRANQNVERALHMLDQHFGSRAAAKEAYAKMQVDDSTKKLLDETARTNPDLFFRMITGGASATPPSTPSNVPGVTKPGSGAPPAGIVSLPWSEAQKLRKSKDRKDREMYNSVDFRARMEAAALEAEAKGINYFAT